MALFFLSTNVSSVAPFPSPDAERDARQCVRAESSARRRAFPPPRVERSGGRPPRGPGRVGARSARAFRSLSPFPGKGTRALGCAHPRRPFPPAPSARFHPPRSFLLPFSPFPRILSFARRYLIPGRAHVSSSRSFSSSPSPRDSFGRERLSFRARRRSSRCSGGGGGSRPSRRRFPAPRTDPPRRPTSNRPPGAHRAPRPGAKNSSFRSKRNRLPRACQTPNDCTREGGLDRGFFGRVSSRAWVALLGTVCGLLEVTRVGRQKKKKKKGRAPASSSSVAAQSQFGLQKKRENPACRLAHSPKRCVIGANLKVAKQSGMTSLRRDLPREKGIEDGKVGVTRSLFFSWQPARATVTTEESSRRRRHRPAISSFAPHVGARSASGSNLFRLFSPAFSHFLSISRLFPVFSPFLYFLVIFFLYVVRSQNARVAQERMVDRGGGRGGKSTRDSRAGGWRRWRGGASRKRSVSVILPGTRLGPRPWREKGD